VRHIVCAVDFSEPSERAVDAAIDFAAALGAKVTLLHAHTAVTEQYPDVTASTAAALDSESRVVATRKLEALANKHGARAKISHAVVNGAPYPTLLEEAQWREADLIVLGTHGRSGLDRLMLGSVAERILRHASIPVLVIPAPHRAAAAAAQGSPS
jgi:nucleotide-binding universal stress UspA family protein